MHFVLIIIGRGKVSKEESQKREDQRGRKSEVRRSERRKSEERRCRCAKRSESRRTLCFSNDFQCFVAPEGRKVGSLKRRVQSHLGR